MNGIRFEDPPPVDADKERASLRHAGISQQLAASPGQWAVVDVKPSAAAAGATAHQIRRGKLRAYVPAGTYEAISRTVDGEFRVYARYVGDDSS